MVVSCVQCDVMLITHFFAVLFKKYIFFKCQSMAGGIGRIGDLEPSIGIPTLS